VPTGLSKRTLRSAPAPARVISLPREREKPRQFRCLVDEIAAGPGDDPGLGGWGGGFANQAHWDPNRPRDWRCWAQSGPTWSAHCGAEVAASDPLGLCQRHRRSLFEDGPIEATAAPEPALNAG
jgi:hypothetical protein